LVSGKKKVGQFLGRVQNGWQPKSRKREESKMAKNDSRNARTGGVSSKDRAFKRGKGGDQRYLTSRKILNNPYLDKNG